MKALLVFLVTFPMAVLAAGGGDKHPEFFHQAGAGAHEVTGALAFGSFDLKIKNAGTSSTDFTGLKINYEYGLSEMFSLGAEISNTSSKTEFLSSETKSTGLNDLLFLFKGNSSLGSSNLRFGADLNYSPGDNETDVGGDSNNYSGGSNLTPYVGWDMNLAPCTFGIKLSRELEVIKRSYDNKDTSTKGERSGAEITELDLFYEHKFNETVLLGAAFRYLTIADSTDEVDGGVSSDSESLTPIYALNIYVPVNLGPGTLLPAFTYVTSPDDKVDTTEIDSYTGNSFAIAYRMAF